MWSPRGDNNVPYHDEETQSKRHLNRLGSRRKSVRWCVGSEAQFENDAAAFVSIHSGRRMSDEVLPTSTAGRRQPLEAGRDGWLHTFDDLESLRHHTEGTLLAQSQVHGVVTPVIGVPFNHD